MARADQRAAQIHAAYRAQHPEGQLDPTVLAEQLDVLLIEQDMAPGVHGMLMRKDGAHVIGINSACGALSRRVAVAHLLGHQQLHQRQPLLIDTDERRGLDSMALPTDREEAEANRFAMYLLAPSATVIREARSAQAPLAEVLVAHLAERFGMPLQLMAVHLMGLGLILDPGDLPVPLDKENLEHHR